MLNQLYCIPSGWAALYSCSQQRERDPLAAKLAVNLAPLQHREPCLARHRPRKQPPLKRRIVEGLRQRPAQSRLLGPPDVPLFTVTGEIFRLRAIARPLKPATWCSRRTSRTLRMDNPLFATASPP